MSGARGEADISDGMSEAGGRPDLPRAWLELRLLAEGVEKVPKLKIFETIIQNAGLH